MEIRHTAAGDVVMTRAGLAATAEDLQRIAEFDHPFTVHADGSLSDDGVDGVYAPDVFHDDAADITIDGAAGTRANGWEALTGYTGQWSYNGAVMHASEYLGGGLARDILAEPGVYVVVVVNVHPGDDDPDGEFDPDDGDGELPEPAGWAILRRVEAGE
jgi:hypothetical protein